MTTGAGVSREKVLDAALELVDAEGLDALSFRRLAARFGVTPMALYQYVESKDALLDGIGDLVLARLELPYVGRRLARPAGRAGALLPLAAPRASGRRSGRARPAAVHSRGAAGCGCLARPLPPRRLPARGGRARYRQTARYLLALIMLEVESGPRLASRERQARARETRAALEALDPERFSSLVAAAPHLAAPFDPERAFESGVELLTAGLERQLSRR